MSQTGLMIYLMTGDIMMSLLMSQMGGGSNIFLMLYLMGYFGKSSGGVTATPTGAGAIAGTALSSALPLLLLAGKKKSYRRRRTYRRGGGYLSGFVKGLSAGRA